MYTWYYIKYHIVPEKRVIRVFVSRRQTRTLSIAFFQWINSKYHLIFTYGAYFKMQICLLWWNNALQECIKGDGAMQVRTKDDGKYEHILF